MGRKTKDQTNTLTIRPIDAERFLLSGYIDGKQIRKQGALIAMEEIKGKLEKEAMEAETARNASHPLPNSWISVPQLRDAEAAFHKLLGSRHTLVACVEAALKTLGDGEPINLSEAVQDYLKSIKSRLLSDRHYGDVKNRLALFLKAIPAKMVGEISPRMIEQYCYREGLATRTKYHDASVIRAFLGYCIYRRWLRASPFEINMAEMKKLSNRDAKRPNILTAAQAEALLKAAIKIDQGRHVPFLLLGLWGGIRNAEVVRLNASDIEFDGAKATVKITPGKSKTASYREVHLPENIVPLLKECIEAGILTDEPVGAPTQFTWGKIREEAKLLTVTRVGKWRSLKTENTIWQPNILRHTGLSYYYKKTGNVTEVARQGGHSTDVSFKHYITLAKAEEAPKFYAITASLTVPKAIPKVA